LARGLKKILCPLYANYVTSIAYISRSYYIIICFSLRFRCLSRLGGLWRVRCHLRLSGAALLNLYKALVLTYGSIPACSASPSWDHPPRVEGHPPLLRATPGHAAQGAVRGGRWVAHGSATVSAIRQRFSLPGARAGLVATSPLFTDCSADFLTHT